MLTAKWGKHMREWGFWEWIGYTSLWVTAVILAIDGGVKIASDELKNLLPEFLESATWSFLPLILLCFGTAILFVRASQSRGPHKIPPSPRVVPPVAELYEAKPVHQPPAFLHPNTLNDALDIQFGSGEPYDKPEVVLNEIVGRTISMRLRNHGNGLLTDCNG